MRPTKKQRKALGRYVRRMANEMELRDWTIDLVYDPPADDDCMAHIKCTYGRKRAQVSFPRDFFSLTPEQQRHAVCHELIHCHASGLEWQFNNLGGRVSPDVFDVLWGGMKDQIEFAVDAMAAALAKHLPLPEYGGKR